MSLFDFTFSLSAVILGLALTHMAASVQRLVLARDRVRWAPEPVLLAAIILLVIVSVWMFQWEERDARETTIGLMLLQVLKLLTLYLAAAFCLPESVEGDTVDLYRHYDRTRLFTFGSLIASLALFTVYYWLRDPPRLGWYLFYVLLYPSLYLLLIFVRRRWVNIVVLAGVLAYYTWEIVAQPIHA